MYISGDLAVDWFHRTAMYISGDLAVDWFHRTAMYISGDLAVDWVTGQLYVVGERNGKGAVSLISVDLTYQHSNTAESHSNQNNDGNHGNGQILALVTQDVLHPFSLVLDPVFKNFKIYFVTM